MNQVVLHALCVAGVCVHQVKLNKILGDAEGGADAPLFLSSLFLLCLCMILYVL